ncbi:Invasion protein invB [Serratia quinivorans]|uniref:InvB/SpaK family type III secretion system chaperone n=1 Tax=Serratia quinivorans TaxID=137545 RepID=UPI00217AAE94|nr:type III secretion system protein [Serratia quinivorans]CAI1904390.1 Invasion protein invB [Serratia quinivorans]
MKYRFVEMLNAFLSDVGRSDLLNPDLNCHSSIQLELADMPSINVDLQGDDILLWSSIMDYDALRLEQASYPLLNVILEYQHSNFPSGQPMIKIMDDKLVVSAVMTEEAMINNHQFSDSLEEFFAYCTRVSDAFAT